MQRREHKNYVAELRRRCQDQHNRHHLINDGWLFSWTRKREAGIRRTIDILCITLFISMLVEEKFSIFVTQEFLFLGMIDNICEIFLTVLSINCIYLL